MITINDIKEAIEMDEGTEPSQSVVEKIEDYAEQAFLEGLKRHTFMKDGVTYVGNGTYTLKQAIQMAKNDGLLSTEYEG